MSCSISWDVIPELCWTKGCDSDSIFHPEFNQNGLSVIIIIDHVGTSYSLIMKHMRPQNSRLYWPWALLITYGKWNKGAMRISRNGYIIISFGCFHWCFEKKTSKKRKEKTKWKRRRKIEKKRKQRRKAQRNSQVSVKHGWKTLLHDNIMRGAHFQNEGMKL